MPEAPYDNLSPDSILDALEAFGLQPTGGLLALNSYENRVYQVQLEPGELGEFVVVKFYRPDRWSRAAILEEHAFTQELYEEEISVVPPLSIDGATLHEHNGFLLAAFTRQGGHPPNLENIDDLEVLSRTIARAHMIGARRAFEHRPQLTCQRLGHDSREFLLGNGFVPAEMEAAYDTVTQHLLAHIEGAVDAAPTIRLHGDCHMGNVLWRNDTPHFVDFDDCLMGPPIQDLWMLLSGDRADQTVQIADILDAYNQFFDFATPTLALIEPLRTLRIMHHAAWIARRWHDPAFPQAFPWFDSPRYWSEHLLALREQQAMLDEPPLTYL